MQYTDDYVDLAFLNYVKKLHENSEYLKNTWTYWNIMFIGNFCKEVVFGGGFLSGLFNTSTTVTVPILYTITNKIIDKFPDKYQPGCHYIIDKAITTYKWGHRILNPQRSVMEYIFGILALSLYNQYTPEDYKSDNLELWIFSLASLAGWNSTSIIDVETPIRNSLLSVPSSLWPYIFGDNKLETEDPVVGADTSWTKARRGIDKGESAMWVGGNASVYNPSLVKLSEKLYICNSTMSFNARCYVDKDNYKIDKVSTFNLIHFVGVELMKKQYVYYMKHSGSVPSNFYISTNNGDIEYKHWINKAIMGELAVIISVSENGDKKVNTCDKYEEKVSISCKRH